MNLVAREFVASRPDQTGVLVLSEMAGAAKEMGEALIINPFHKEDFAKAIEQALTMPVEDQVPAQPTHAGTAPAIRCEPVGRRFCAGPAVHAKNGSSASRPFAHGQSPGGRGSAVPAASRALLLDYDGTLVPFVDPKLARPDAELLELIAPWRGPANDMVIVSGRSRHDLEAWFGRLPVALVAEHGVWLRSKNANWRMLKTLTTEWKERVRPILQLYVDRLPGRFAGGKGVFARLALSPRGPRTGFASRPRNCWTIWPDYTRNIDVQVLEGNKVVEVRNTRRQQRHRGTGMARANPARISFSASATIGRMKTFSALCRRRPARCGSDWPTRPRAFIWAVTPLSPCAPGPVRGHAEGSGPGRDRAGIASRRSRPRGPTNFGFHANWKPQP